ncbi:MAG TPA: ABC transporter ATP-binding protein [Acidimicrobiales bacterium]|nr:ABC transporter ATP-binding protein [Acidimicrobiales bacterium]
MSNLTDGWRGVAAEDHEVVASVSGLAAFLRGRSRRLLGSLLRPHRRALWGLVVLVLIENAAALAGPYLIKVGIDRGIPRMQDHQGSGTLVRIVGLFLLTLAVQQWTLNRFLIISGKVGQDVLADLRTRLFAHFQRLSLAFHEHYTSGRVISRLTSDVEALSELLATGMQDLVTAALSIGGVAIVLLFLDLPLGLATLAVFPLIIALTIWFRARSSEAYRASREAVALVIVHFVESLGGIRAVQAFRREPRNQEIFEEVNARYRDANIWSGKLGAVYGPGVRGLGHVTTAVVLLYGGTRVLDEQISLGVLAAFLLYVRRFFEPMQELAQFYNVFQSAAAGLEKLSGVLEEPLSVPEPVAPVPLPEAAGEVRFDHVRFGYREKVVLPDLDVTIPAGQTVALVGETGAGKTTVARLIARFYDPNEGQIVLDGVDLRDLSNDDLRRAVVMITQEGFLFSGSVADNIAFGKPSATRAEIEEAAKVIGAHEFLSALPDGYDTDVRKRGGRLSAGQRQLVAFARAFLADPRVLILDEATSSLDIPSERLVQRALRTLLADRTAVIIAHRLSTVEIADRVLVIDAGRVVEDGSPADLITGAGRYSALHQQWLDSLV